MLKNYKYETFEKISFQSRVLGIYVAPTRRLCGVRRTYGGLWVF
jgi:hypothetical protein